VYRPRRVHRQRQCHLYFARRVSSLSCADIVSAKKHVFWKIAALNQLLVLPAWLGLRASEKGQRMRSVYEVKKWARSP
jgi:hypothetical protein